MTDSMTAPNDSGPRAVARRPRTTFRGAPPGSARGAADADRAAIAEAFSRTAKKYDAFAEDHPHLTRMRRRVYEQLERYVAPGSSILELNAGTGTDAVQLARRGFRVHATDIAPGMLDLARDKVERFDLAGRVSVQECSFLQLDRIEGGQFDAVFSNLGGLNCTADLRPVVAQLDRVLRPGGVVVWVLMPPICLWELGLAFTGQFGLAFRRLARHGTRAHLEGRHFKVHYFTPRRAAAAFGDEYEVLAVEGLSVITPTAESKNLAQRHRDLYRTLAWLDDRIAPHAPASGWGDFYILSVRRRASPPIAAAR
ncbi:MAG TPA: class I SAM-dependent methyltransferase [Candidatus Saccharimonadales bacterium]|nr:class I SAM-dependent methyltransferase [Candidatus Saccharimonadales bacterium]